MKIKGVNYIEGVLTASVNPVQTTGATHVSFNGIPYYDAFVELYNEDKNIITGSKVTIEGFNFEIVHIVGLKVYLKQIK